MFSLSQVQKRIQHFENVMLTSQMVLAYIYQNITKFEFFTFSTYTVFKILYENVEIVNHYAFLKK